MRWPEAYHGRFASAVRRDTLAGHVATRMMRTAFYVGLFLFIACAIGVALAGAAAIWDKYERRGGA